ncbi:MAG: cupredoxin domain-containing protein [Candidatus Kerfeldbacteria bacterium]
MVRNSTAACVIAGTILVVGAVGCPVVEPAEQAATPIPTNASTAIVEQIEDETATDAVNVNMDGPLAMPEVTYSDSQQAEVEHRTPDKMFSVTSRQFEFEPSELRVKEGDLVQITLTSEDVTHGLSLPEFDVYLQVSKGEEETVEFIADEPGAYVFFCNVFCGIGHSEMKGQLIVE